MIKSSQISCDMVDINADNPFHIDPENKPDQSLKWLEVMESIKIQKRADHRASEMALHNSKKYQMLGLPNLGAMHERVGHLSVLRQNESRQMSIGLQIL